MIRNKNRPWSVTALALLLLLETIALVSIGSFRTYQIVNIPDGTWRLEWVRSSTTLALEGGLAFLTFLAAIGFLRVWRVGWLFAMLVQGIVLYVLLRLHFLGEIENRLDYAVMAFVVFIVLYLNYYEVRQLFRSEPGGIE